MYYPLTINFDGRPRACICFTRLLGLQQISSAIFNPHNSSFELFVKQVMNMAARNKAAKTNIVDSSSVPLQQDCYEGERLVEVLKSIQRGIESARVLAGNSLPEKIWLKQQFAIGVNDVTRVLERMAAIGDKGSSAPAACVRLQAVFLAADCNPRWLMKHLPSLASSRNVPLIFVKDDKKGSLRLGELVKLKTALAIGVKARGNAINQIIRHILEGDEVNHGGYQLKSNEISLGDDVQ